MNQFAVEPKHRGEEPVAQPHGALDDDVEDRLEVGRRARDHPQDLGRRRLLLQRLVSSRFRASSSVNSRTFSIAMTAWSAKVSRSAICLSENGLTSRRAIAMAPIGVALAQHRHRQTGPVAQRCVMAWIRILGTPSPSMSATWTIAPVEDCAPATACRGSGPCGRCADALPRAPRRMPCDATRWSSSPSKRKTSPSQPPRTRERRFAAIASKTGWTSVGELEMTRRISLVAVCCSSASVSSRFRASELREQPHVLDRDHRLVGEGLEQLDLLVGEGTDLGAPHNDRTDRPRPP